jgi:hypothetical protein
MHSTSRWLLLSSAAAALAFSACTDEPVELAPLAPGEVDVNVTSAGNDLWTYTGQLGDGDGALAPGDTDDSNAAACPADVATGREQTFRFVPPHDGSLMVVLDGARKADLLVYVRTSDAPDAETTFCGMLDPTNCGFGQSKEEVAAGLPVYFVVDRDASAAPGPIDYTVSVSLFQ